MHVILVLSVACFLSPFFNFLSFFGGWSMFRHVMCHTATNVLDSPVTPFHLHFVLSTTAKPFLSVFAATFFLSPLHIPRSHTKKTSSPCWQGGVGRGGVQPGTSTQFFYNPGALATQQIFFLKTYTNECNPLDGQVCKRGYDSRERSRKNVMELKEKKNL